MSAYYNEFDPEKAEWIRELMKAGVVADGEVDERSITDVQASELAGFKQCHFFAGIAVWSFALRLAGWGDDEPVWTGSCPCPSFSAAGKGQGFDDPRHLWPDWARLVRQSRPPVIFGEQADKAIGYGWVDLVQADLEAQDYAFGKAVLGAASVGAPHIRQRLYFVADSGREQHRGWDGLREAGNEPGEPTQAGAGGTRHLFWSSDDAGNGSASGSMADPAESRRDGRWAGKEGDDLATTERGRGEYKPQRLCAAGELGNPEHSGHGGQEAGTPKPSGNREEGRLPDGAGFTGGFWRDAEWIWCRDQKWRPVEPGSFPLAHGAAARVLRLRGYGDAINAEVAKAFIESYREVRGEMR